MFSTTAISVSDNMRWIRQVHAAILVTWIVAVTCTAASESKEYCQMQTFEATCKEDEVILMKESRYGRMRLGKCLTRNYYVGCSADVTDHMHARCSGRRHCRVPIPDPAMFAAQPCPKDLVAYMEADYECVKVAKWNAEDCIGGGPQILTATEGYISKPPTKSNDQKHVCPRRIVAEPGQTINIYLNDFFSKHNHNDAADNDHHGVITKPECITYGYVAEEGVSKPARICGGEFKKNQLIYSSDSNVVDITLTEPSAHSHHYLLNYEVVGCPQLEVPENAWIQILQETAVVTCNNTKTAFHLVCVGNEWVGELQNCTEAEVEKPIADSMSGTSRLPFGNIFVNTGLFLAISIGVALGVLLGIGLLTLAHTFYSTRRAQRKHVQQPTDQGQTSLLKKPSPFTNDQCMDSSVNVDYHHLPVDQYQHVHVPMNMDNCGEYGTKSFIPLVPIRHIGDHLYEAPRPGDLSTFRAARVTMSTFGDYDTALDARVPTMENTYGPIGGDRTMHTYGPIGGDRTMHTYGPIGGDRTLNTYGLIGGDRPMRITEVDGRTTLPVPDCCHNIHDLAALTNLGRDKIITIDDAIPS